MIKNFQIYRSSAGSGKTYTLALSFISLAIQGDRYGYHDYYRRILAITFTNKAASEMKERVLYYLECLSKKEDKDSILDWLKKDTNYDDKEIFARAAVIHKHILHNYADLGILTIDKFTYKIVRTFASDLGLSHNFDLEMDNYKIIQRKCLETRIRRRDSHFLPVLSSVKRANGQIWDVRVRVITRHTPLKTRTTKIAKA